MSRVALVAGATRGIGHAAAAALARRGALVVCAGRSATSIATVVDVIERGGGAAEGRVVDLHDGDAVRALVDDVVARHGRLDAAFNNGGPLTTGSIAELTRRGYLDDVGANLRTTYLCLTEELRAMHAQGWGAIVNCGSGAAHSAKPGRASYVTAKWAVLGMTMAAASATVRVNQLSPGVVGDRDVRHDDVLLGRPGGATEYGDAVAWLLSDDARAINGAALRVDGGLTASSP